MRQSCVFSHCVLSDSLQPHRPQHAGLPCLLSPGVGPNSCPLSWWCHPTISSSVTLFSSCLQSFSASVSFPVSQLFPSDGQNIWASSVLLMNTWGLVPLGLTGLISLLSKGLSRIFCSTTVQKHQFLGSQPSLWSNSHICTWLLEKLYLWLDRLVGKVMPLLFNMLSGFVIAFLPRNKCLLILWLQSPSTVILEPPKIKSDTVSPSICCEVMGSDAMILIFWMLSIKPAFSLSSSTFIKRLFSSSSLSAI